MVLPEAWASDIEVLRLGGAVIEEHTDHVVVRSPGNPGYHWGNFLLVTDPHAGQDADRWIEAFDAEFPGAAHVAIGLPAEPPAAPWARRGLQVEVELVLRATEPCPLRPQPHGYVVRPLAGAGDWMAMVGMDVAEQAAPGRDGEHFRVFAERRAATRAELASRGHAVFLGAFEPVGGLAAHLGIVLCGPVAGHRELARFQHVGTSPAHRGRGLAGHLLGVAALWAAERGADAWELHVEPGTAAHRLYASLGFRPAGLAWQVYRVPAADGADDVPQASGAI